MRVGERLAEILRAAVVGHTIPPDDAAWLLDEIDVQSDEGRELLACADQLTHRWAGDVGEIHAQIGVNIAPCGNNCGFCGFAARAGLFTERSELELDEVVERAKAFATEGASAIYLMTAGEYNFQRFLSMARTVRAILPPDVLLVANTDDLGPDEARDLATHGFQAAYHVVRLGEGQQTGIEPQKRLATMRAILAAGLRLAYCVEPVGPEHTTEEIVDRITLGRELSVWFSGAMRRIPVEGTLLAGCGVISELELAKVVAVSRLVMGPSVRTHCTHEPSLASVQAGANLLWAESGANPRDLAAETSDGRGLTVTECREMLGEAGYAASVGYLS